MPPHAPEESPVPGLPVRHSVLRPGAISTGCAVVAAAALLAQFSTLAADLSSAERTLLADDRVHSLASAVSAFGEASPGSGWRPLVHASLAFDAFVSGSGPGAPRAPWFHAVGWLLHAANAALVYLLLANLTKRKLGAPLLAATLWAVHPLAVGPATALLGRAELLATLCGLSSAVLLVRSPGKPRLLAVSVALWGLGLFAGPAAASLPVLVGLGLVAYHEVEPARFRSPRLRNAFLWFLVPAAAYLAVRIAVPGTAAGPGLVDSLVGAGSVFLVGTIEVLLPVRLPRDGSAACAGAAAAAAGLAAFGACIWFGVTRLRRHALAFPLLAFAATMTSAMAAGAVLDDRALYLPAAFLLLGVAEGLEGLYYRWAAPRGLAVTLVLFLVLPGLSHAAASAWRDGSQPPASSPR